MTAWTVLRVWMLVLRCVADEPERTSTVAMEERSFALVGWMVGE